MDSFPLIAYGFLLAVVVIALLLWAAKTGQFRDQNRARFLPLDDGDGDDGIPRKPPERPRVGVLTGVILMLGAFALAVVSFLLLHARW
jgi:nitrogen fixation-related uncharacterized protein